MTAPCKYPLSHSAVAKFGGSGEEHGNKLWVHVGSGAMRIFSGEEADLIEAWIKSSRPDLSPPELQPELAMTGEDIRRMLV